MRATIRSRITTEDLVAWTGRGLEALWLLAVVLVPLSFSPRELLLSESELAYIDIPKVAILRILAALIASLWIFEWVLQSRSSSTYSFKIGGPGSWPRMWLAELKDWLFDQPTRWLTLAVVLYLGSTLISTILSASFKVSMWGLIPGQDTYPAYTIITYVILFGVVTTHLKSSSQMVRLIAAIVGTGVLIAGYAIAQHFGSDVFGLMQIPSSGRAGSTMGNSIMAGSVLLLTISISLMAATAMLQDLPIVRRFWWKAGLWSLVVAMQLLGIIYTLSRGPGISTIVALAVFLGLVALFVGWRSVLRASLVLGVAVGLTAAVLGISGTASDCVGGTRFSPCVWKTKSVLDLPLPETAGEDSSLIHMTVGDIGITVTTYTSAGRDVLGGGFSSRMDIWKTSWRIMQNLPWAGFESLSLHSLRPLIGYGPDLFKYTYLLERRPQGPDRTLISNRFAHNYFIHKTVELGFLGLLTTLGIFTAFFVVGGYLLVRERVNHSAVHTLVLAGLLATIAGRLLEQSVGVAAVSDLTITWILLAAFVSLPTIMATTQPALAPGPQSNERHCVVESKPAPVGGLGDGRMAWRLGLATTVVLAVGLVTWFKGVSYPWAAVEARHGVNQLLENNLPGALTSLDRAIVLAPDVAVYHNLKATLYSSYRNKEGLNREPECGHLETPGLYNRCLDRKAYQSNSDGSAQRPFSSPSRRVLAESALNLALLEDDASLTSEAISLFREVADLDPQAWTKWERLALAYIQVDQPAAALPHLERSLTILQGSSKAENAYLIRGMSYRALGQLDRAVRSFDRAFLLNPSSAQALSNRGGVYNELGQYQRAIEDLDVAIAYNSRLPIAYNNRGNSFGNLDQLDRAMADFDEAIRLDPTLASAYYNRALTNTLLVRDVEAQRDAERAVALGSDADALDRTIEALKKTR